MVGSLECRQDRRDTSSLGWVREPEVSAPAISWKRSGQSKSSDSPQMPKSDEPDDVRTRLEAILGPRGDQRRLTEEELRKHSAGESDAGAPVQFYIGDHDEGRASTDSDKGSSTSGSGGKFPAIVSKVAKTPRHVGFGCIEEVEVPMHDEVRARAEAKGLKQVRKKHQSHRPVRRSPSLLEEHYVSLVRAAVARSKAGKLAAKNDGDPELGRGSWTVVWDNARGAHVVIWRSKHDDNPLKPFYLGRKDAIKLLDPWWTSFRHEGEVPGPAERVALGSDLGWLGASIWNKKSPAVAGPAKRSGKAGEAKVEQWLIDSGCGWDLVDAQMVAHLADDVGRAAIQPKLWTANGVTQVENDVPLWIQPFGEVCRPLVMESSPDVLSMGRQCVERGYTFVWEGHSSEPYFILPDARRLYCTVEGYIPFLDAKARPVP